MFIPESLIERIHRSDVWTKKRDQLIRLVARFNKMLAHPIPLWGGPQWAGRLRWKKYRKGGVSSEREIEIAYYAEARSAQVKSVFLSVVRFRGDRIWWIYTGSNPLGWTRYRRTAKRVVETLFDAQKTEARRDGGGILENVMLGVMTELTTAEAHRTSQATRG